MYIFIFVCIKIYCLSHPGRNRTGGDGNHRVAARLAQVALVVGQQENLSARLETPMFTYEYTNFQ